MVRTVALLGAALLLCAFDSQHAEGRRLTVGEELTACYIGVAHARGALSCHPPNSLVDSVFGACLNEEAAVKADIASKHAGDKILADKVLAEIRRRESPSIQSSIVSAQTASARCR